MNRLEINQSHFALDISLRWMSPGAYFLVFFCLFWDGFLVVWYSIALSSGETSAEFILFPLLHVAVGIGLTYYTICLFVNSTHISADERNLSVQHGPLPWPRGNKEIATRDISQLYVKESVSDKGQRSYSLLARTQTGEDVKLISGIMVAAEKLLMLEETIENYLGIIDQRVTGEFLSEQKNNPSLTRNPATAPTASPGYGEKRGIEKADLGHFVTYERHTFEVTHVTTYHWNNGDIDRMLQLAAANGQQTLVYIAQNKGLFQTFLEIEFNRAQQAALKFSHSPTPHALNYDGIRFEQFSHQIGQAYLPRKATGLSAEQWIYQSSKGEERLRIVDNEGMQSVFFGQKEIPAAFGEVLAP
jgi:hypothetical protein